jgi:hypothetical protein
LSLICHCFSCELRLFSHGFAFPQPIRKRQQWIEDHLLEAKRQFEELNVQSLGPIERQDAIVEYLFQIAGIKAYRSRKRPLPAEGDASDDGLQGGGDNAISDDESVSGSDEMSDDVSV